MKKEPINLLSILFLFSLVPETPHWLLTKNKNQKAYNVLKRIANSNKRELPIEYLSFQAYSHAEDPTTSKFSHINQVKSV
jgi:hypothetical protein